MYILYCAVSNSICKLKILCTMFFLLGFKRAHSEQALIAHACHGHTLQLSRLVANVKCDTFYNALVTQPTTNHKAYPHLK